MPRVEGCTQAMGEREKALMERGYQLLGALRQDPEVGSIRLAQEHQAVQLWFETPGGQVWHLSLEPHER